MAFAFHACFQVAHDSVNILDRVFTQGFVAHTDRIVHAKLEEVFFVSNDNPALKLRHLILIILSLMRIFQEYPNNPGLHVATGIFCAVFGYFLAVISAQSRKVLSPLAGISTHSMTR